MTALYRQSIRHPILVIFLAVSATVAVTPGLARLRLRTDGNALLPADAPEIRIDQTIRDTFAIKDQLVVVIRSSLPQGVYNIHTLNLVRELTRRIGGLEEIAAGDITSLATEKSDRVIPGTLRFKAFLEPPPKTDADLARIRKDLRDIRLYLGTLVSYDEASTCILVGVPRRVDRPRLCRKIQELIAGLGEVPEEIAIVGAPVAEALLGAHILADLGVPSAWLGFQFDTPADATRAGAPGALHQLRLWIGRRIGLVPVAISVMALVFLLTFKRMVAALLPMAEVGACLLFVFSLMGWFGVPIYLTIAVLPIILTAMGVADEIHIFSHYRHLLSARSQTHYVRLVETTMDQMWQPVTKTSFTTAFCFLSFCLSPLKPVQAFGVFTAVGIVFCWLWSLTVIPAFLVLLPRHWCLPRPVRTTKTIRADRKPRFERLASAVLRRRGLTLALTLVLLAAAPWGVRRLTVQDSWIDGFARDSAFYQATQAVNTAFRGTHILVVSVDTGWREIAGELADEDVQIYRLILPADRVADPGELKGLWVEIDSSSAVKTDASGSRRRRPPPPRRAPIQTAEIENGRLVITTDRSFGLLRSGSRAVASEPLSYRIAPHGLLEPRTFDRLCGLEAFIEQRTEHAVGGALGPCAFLSTLNYSSRARKEAHRRIPDTPREIRRLWGHYERVRGAHRLRQVLDETETKCLVTVFLKNANYLDTAWLMEDIRAYEREHLAPQGIRLGFAGDVATSQTLIRAIVGTQLRSLGLSLAGILAVTTLFSRSLRWGFLQVLPCCLAVLTNFAVMGVFDIPIGVATSMFAAMTLGIGVDYAIHLTERYRMLHTNESWSGSTDLRASSHPVLAQREPASTDGPTARRRTVIQAVGMAGPAILIDALAIALGFGVLVLSQVPSNARLGALVIVSVLGCFVWTLVLLPVLLTYLPLTPTPRRNTSGQTAPQASEVA